MAESAAIERPIALHQNDHLWIGRFAAMASPCEVLMATKDKSIAKTLVNIAASEAWRIEQKYSRYRSDGIVARINNSNGVAVSVDAETAQLINFAYQCYKLSDGLFDISSGILRKAWLFKSDSTLPSQELINTLLPFVGLNKAHWEAPDFTLPTGMQIDFGGIGKEYAVDQSLTLTTAHADIPILINFGGDIACNRCPTINQPWRVGIEATDQQNQVSELLEISTGALATSGSTQRYLIHKGKRYSHVLNPLTGWPIEGAPLSATVAAGTCTQAGMLATFAMLQGKGAETFLKEQEVKFWVKR